MVMMNEKNMDCLDLKLLSFKEQAIRIGKILSIIQADSMTTDLNLCNKHTSEEAWSETQETEEAWNDVSE